MGKDDKIIDTTRVIMTRSKAKAAEQGTLKGGRKRATGAVDDARKPVKQPKTRVVKKKGEDEEDETKPAAAPVRKPAKGRVTKKQPKTLVVKKHETVKKQLDAVDAEEKEAVVPKMQSKMDLSVMSVESDEEDGGKGDNKTVILSSDEDEDDVIPIPRKWRVEATPVVVPVPQPPKPTPPKPDVSAEAASLLREIDPYFSDQFIRSGKFKAEVLGVRTEEYSNIIDYIKNSQAHNFGVKLEGLLKLDRVADLQTPAADTPASKLKMMLWHGTRSNRVGQILEFGFRTPASGAQMFGQGVYFADRITKSAQYCADHVVRLDSIGYVFLCEVQLGTIYNAKNPNHGYKAPPDIVRKNGEVTACQSLMCTGQYIPSREAQKKIDDVIWCVGPTVQNSRFESYTTLYNEFIVYDASQIRIKYLAKVRFMAAPYFGAP